MTKEMHIGWKLEARRVACAALLLAGCTGPGPSLALDGGLAISRDGAEPESTASSVNVADGDSAAPSWGEGPDDGAVSSGGPLDAGPGDDGADSGDVVVAGPDDDDDDVTVDDGAPPCDLAGTWATKVTAATSWQAGFAIAAGTGTSHVWAKYQTRQDGSLVPGSMIGCGIVIPDFVAGPLLEGERYAIDFDVPLFDAVPPRAVATDTTIRVGGRRAPGDPISIGQTAMVLGTTFSDPLNDPWPIGAAIDAEDTDGDGKPGVTLPHVTDDTRVYLPVDVWRNARADLGYYAARVVLSANGTLETCDEIKGKAVISRFDTHVIGCRLLSGDDCGPLQVATLDTFRPTHKVDSATYEAVRVVDGASCADARSVLP